MIRYVVDASVGAKWFFEENYAAESRRLLSDGHALFAPDYFRVELVNVAWKKAMRGELSAAAARLVASGIDAAGVWFAPDDALLEPALHLSLEHRVAVYDSLYLALGLREGCQVVTADRPFHDALTAAFPGTMLWVGDVPAAP